jgi:hypothetical protein
MTDASLPFSREQIRTFARADAMFGMAFPYMRAIAPAKRRRTSLIRALLSGAAKFLF